MSKPDQLLRIGQFAKASRLSIKALRLYDRLAILQPAYLDPDTGYRYYHHEQLEPARLIRTLRQMEMPLALVRQVLVADPDTAVILLTEYRQAYDARAHLVRRTTQLLIDQFKDEVKKMTLAVEIKQCEREQIASIKQHVRIQALGRCIRDNLKALTDYIAGQPGQKAGAPFGIYHGAINETDDGPIEVCLPVSGTITAAGDISVRELSATQVASVIVQDEMCDFPHILRAYDAAYDWIAQNGYEIADSPREIWWSSPDEPGKMEVVWPFREKNK